MLTPGMRQAAQISNTASNQIQSQFAAIGSSGKRMGASVDELHARLQAINKVRFSTTIQKEFDIATRAAAKLENQIDKLQNKKSGGGIGLGSILGGLGIAGVAKEALGQAAMAENQKVAFGVLTGSQKEGDALYGNINKMADSTPFESQDLGRSAKTMLGYGVDKKQIMPTLSMLGDISAATDNPADSLQSLALAFGQVSAKGHLAGQETLQMINAGFNPLKEISDVTGISMDTLNKAQEDGAISADMVTLAFKHATGDGGKYHEMMKKQSETLGGKWSTFMDGVHHKLRALGDLLRPAAIWIMDFGSALMSGEGPALAIAFAIAGITLALKWNSISLGAASGAMAIYNAICAANPIMLYITLIIALGIWIYSICRQYEGWGQSINALWEIIKTVGSLWFLPYKMFAETAWFHVQKLWYNMKDFARNIGGIFANVGKAWELAKSGDFTGAKSALAANIETGASKELAALEVSHKANQAGYALELVNGKQSIAANYAKIGLHKIAKPAGATDATKANGTPDYKGGFAGLDKFGAKGKADSIASGGQRSVVINIGKQIERLEFTVMDAKESADKIEAVVRESIRRVMYSINGVAAS